MSRLENLRHRVIQTLHDPVTKALMAGTGLAHWRESRELLSSILGTPIRYSRGAPDHLATGADRPVLGGTRGGQSVEAMKVDWRSTPFVTHPLQRAIARLPATGMPLGTGAQARMREINDAIEKRLFEDALEDVDAPRWDDEEALRRVALALWRDMPALMRMTGLGTLWLPADTRCPDHSIADHSRVAAAAAFVTEKANDPWMVALTIGGVQAYIEQSRTSRDLWTASMIYAELAWAAMLPIVEECGPEAILYPDLRGNPFADQWLLDQGIKAVPPSFGQAYTHAAMLPNTFVALVPRRELIEEAQRQVRVRWLEMGEAVRRRLVALVGTGSWDQIWRRQVDDREGPPVYISAARWRKRMENLGKQPALAFLPGHAGETPTLPAVLQERERALRPWVSERLWNHYEHAQRVYWATDQARGTRYLSTERGFDYALVHGQVRHALALAKVAARPTPRVEPGEKCSLTGTDQVLNNEAGLRLGEQRSASRAFWRHPRLDPEKQGTERLGAPAAVKRFLAQSDDKPFQRRHGYSRDSNVPFPSTAAIAAQPFLAKLSEEYLRSGSVALAMDEVVRRVHASDLPPTTAAPEAQPRLAAFLKRSPGLDAFLAMEPAYLHAAALETYETRGVRGVAGLRQAVIDLHKAAPNLHIGTHVGVLKADGDNIGKLVLGDPEVIKATWGDVLHPHVVDRISQGWAGAIPWRGLLGVSRHIGPGVHSAISRALATFAHTIVGWVVEREFGGRLIYAGGDDVLAIFPAADTIPAAARLQQLFSAPYVLDTMYETPWSWRDGEVHTDVAQARARFRVPKLGDGAVDFSADWPEEAHTNEVAAGPRPPLDARSDIFTQLGRHASLSAGVVLAHYKTPLQRMLQESRRLLDDHAKVRVNPTDHSKARLAAAWMSRSGEKLAFVGRWGMPVGPPPILQRHLKVLADGFRDRNIAGRAPYLLRTALARLTAAELANPDLRTGLLANAGFGAPRTGSAADPLTDAARFVFDEGLEEARRLSAGDSRWAQTAVAGLLLARHLSTLEAK